MNEIIVYTRLSFTSESVVCLTYGSMRMPFAFASPHITLRLTLQFTCSEQTACIFQRHGYYFPKRKLNVKNQKWAHQSQPTAVFVRREKNAKNAKLDKQDKSIWFLLRLKGIHT